MDHKKWNKIDMFIDMDKNPLEKYNYFKIDFTICNYLFIIPETFSNLFSSFYTKILEKAILFFPKNFQEAEDLLNAYEIEEGNKENWIVISPCTELENNIEIYHKNKNIYRFIAYCPIFNHEHNDNYLYKFNKYYGEVDSCSELVDNYLNYEIFFILEISKNIIFIIILILLN